MGQIEFRIHSERQTEGYSLAWTLAGHDPQPERLLELPYPFLLETAEKGALTVDGARYPVLYRDWNSSGETMVGRSEADASGARYRLEDRWRQIDECLWRVDRTLEILSCERESGFRLVLEFTPALDRSSFEHFRYFAPPALYDLNDLNEDGIEDYLETRSLSFREDRLNALTLLAYHAERRLGFALSRADLPQSDPESDRRRGQTAFFQRTDVGSIGIKPEGAAGGRLAFFAACPFVERERSHALLVRGRVPWGAYWPASSPETIHASYFLQLVYAPNVHEALWQVWDQRLRTLQPKPVRLAASLGEISNQRLTAALDYYLEESTPPYAAGFVTNCHPQDGRQLSNVMQYGFTGQNTTNALNLLRAVDSGAISATNRQKALRVFEFFVETVSNSKIGLSYGVYNFDTKRFASWWMGLLLPLAYAEPGQGLEDLMGPLYEHLRSVIEQLRDKEGMYLRCAAEEYEPLLRAYEIERKRGENHDGWFTACLKFGDFLLASQQADGSWMRAYSFEGQPIVAPEAWFGPTEVQRKSSTATVVPFLLSLHGLTGDGRWLTAARRAGHFVQETYVDGLKFNGGIHDSIYAKPQLVDGESIMFACRALWKLYQGTGEKRYLDGTIRAARLVVTWVCLWDVPLPTQSTLAKQGFRSTGWMACDSPGAGYVHPMGLLAVPELVEIGLATGEEAFFRAAELLQAGCNETVSLPGKDWGYAKPGLQEEGLLISWWFADDPIFTDTGFGGRGKGEGNKTCLPWIAAISVYAHHELLERFGTANIAEIRSRQSGNPADQ